jgi:hypothetical protein
MTQGNLSSITETAFEAIRNNISILPIKADGSKKPTLYSWDTFKTTRPNLKQINNWFNNNFHYGIGIIGGIVSENLEVLDFDKKDYFIRYSEAAVNAGLGELLERLKRGYFEQTPNGFHLAWRCPDGVEGNKKLARVYLYNDDGSPKLLENGKHETKAVIETRGEGGYAIIAPSNGKVHPSGKGYQLIKGSLSTIPVITGQERIELLNLARTLDEVTEPGTEWKPNEKANGQELGGRPGDDFNNRADWETILTPHGWKPVHRHDNGKIDWRRPGKNEGISATTNHADSELLYVFSSSTEFEQEKGYSKFSTYTLLNFNNDYSAAAKELVKLGYGEKDERAGVGIDFGGFEGVKFDKETEEIIEGESDLRLAEFDATDEGNVQAFRLIYGDDFLYCASTGWMAWNGKFWDSSLAESQLDAKITEILKRRRIAAVSCSKEAVVKASITNRGRINACAEAY